MLRLTEETSKTKFHEQVITINNKDNDKIVRKSLRFPWISTEQLGSIEKNIISLRQQIKSARNRVKFYNGKCCNVERNIKIFHSAEATLRPAFDSLLLRETKVTSLIGLYSSMVFVIKWLCTDYYQFQVMFIHQSNEGEMTDRVQRHLWSQKQISCNLLPSQHLQLWL